MAANVWVRARLQKVAGALALGVMLAVAAPAAAQDDVIRPGDELLISIPEVGGAVQRVATVGLNGEVSLGVYGDVAVEGLTIREAERLVREHLSRYLRSTSGVTLSLERRQRVVLVTGQVVNPGLATLEGAADPWLAVQAAGGPAPGADLQRTVIVREGREIPVDLRAYLTGELDEPLPELLLGDTVFVPAQAGLPAVTGAAEAFLGEEALQSKVFVLGAVGNPGVFDRSPGLNPLTALALAGGPTAGADLSNVRLITMTGSQRVDLQAWMLGEGAGPNEIPTDGGAIMYVPTRTTGGAGDPLTARVYLMGSVANAGALEVSGPTPLLELLGRAGGYVGGADLTDVTVIQQRERYALHTHLDLDEYIEDGGGAGGMMVYPGDVVIVGTVEASAWERVISVVGDLALISGSVLLWVDFMQRND